MEAENTKEKIIQAESSTVDENAVMMVCKDELLTREQNKDRMSETVFRIEKHPIEEDGISTPWIMFTGSNGPKEPGCYLTITKIKAAEYVSIEIARWEHGEYYGMNRKIVQNNSTEILAYMPIPSFPKEIYDRINR